MKDLNKIKSLCHRLDNKMTLSEAEEYNKKIELSEMTESNETGSYYEEEGIVAFAGYYGLNDSELMEYARMSPQSSGLNVCIYLDDGESYKNWKHQLWVLVGNGYEYPAKEYVALSVEENPKVLNNTQNIRLSANDLQQVRRFVSKYNKIITNIANGVSSSATFMQKNEK